MTKYHFSIRDDWVKNAGDTTVLACEMFISGYRPRFKNVACLNSLIGSLRKVPTNSKVFLRGLLNMREKQILTSIIEIQKEIGG